MTLSQARFATSLSWFVALIALVACTASQPSRSLAGPTACETMECGSGQLCRDEIAQDAGVTATCTTVPPGCPVFDCSPYHGSACPDCIERLCAYYPTVGEIQGRALTCWSY